MCFLITFHFNRFALVESCNLKLSFSAGTEQPWQNAIDSAQMKCAVVVAVAAARRLFDAVRWYGLDADECNRWKNSTLKLDWRAYLSFNMKIVWDFCLQLNERVFWRKREKMQID